jgi:hypothetical protein
MTSNLAFRLTKGWRRADCDLNAASVFATASEIQKHEAPCLAVINAGAPQLDRHHARRRNFLCGGKF